MSPIDVATPGNGANRIGKRTGAGLHGEEPLARLLKDGYTVTLPEAEAMPQPVHGRHSIDIRHRRQLSGPGTVGGMFQVASGACFRKSSILARAAFLLGLKQRR